MYRGTINLKKDENLWLIADLHLDDIGVLEGFHRPFETLWDMNHAIEENWNEVVHPNDTVWILGDFCDEQLGAKAASRFMNRLNGQKYFLAGDHDINIIRHRKEMIAYTDGTVQFIGDIAILYYHDKQVVDTCCFILSHWPLYRWPHMNKDGVNVHGHSHGDLKVPLPRTIDIGVDARNYYPTNLLELVEEFFYEPNYANA